MAKLPESNSFAFVLKLWTATVALHWTIAAVAVAFFEKGRDYRVTGSWADVWLRSDGLQYLRIAQYGYFPDRLGPEGWFPGYPICIRILAPLLGYEASAVAISHLCFLLALWVLSQLLEIDSDPQFAAIRSAPFRNLGLTQSERCLVLLASFPTSFFFLSTYSESLFLLLVTSAFWSARCRHWFIAGSLASLACAVRPVGIVLMPALAWEWFHQPNRRPLSLIWLGLMPVPILMFFSHLKAQIGNFWGYLRFQNDMADRIGSWHHLHLPGMLGILAGSLTLLLFWRRGAQLRGSYRIYVGLSLLLPFWHSLWTSQPRYSLVLFPLLLCLDGVVCSRRFYWYLALSLLLQIGATISFVSGQQILY